MRVSSRGAAPHRSSSRFSCPGRRRPLRPCPLLRPTEPRQHPATTRLPRAASRSTGEARPGRSPSRSSVTRSTSRTRAFVGAALERRRARRSPTDPGSARFATTTARRRSEPRSQLSATLPATRRATPSTAGAASALECRQRATSDLLVGAGYRAVLALGDLQYENGELSKFRASYDPSWGRVKAITRPVPGNHEYETSGAAGYYQYFGAAAGDPAKGYYSFDLGGWHLIALNSNCSAVGGCGAGSSAGAVAPGRSRRHTRPRPARSRTGTTRGSPPASTEATRRTQPFWQALYDANADLVLVGHDHDYERFAPQTPSGALDRGARDPRSSSSARAGRACARSRLFGRTARRATSRASASSSSRFGADELRLALPAGRRLLHGFRHRLLSLSWRSSPWGRTSPSRSYPKLTFVCFRIGPRTTSRERGAST